MSHGSADGWDVLERAQELSRRGEEFAIATVVWRSGPSSGQTGARALITSSGQVFGFIGGACAEPVVIREAQRVIAWAGHLLIVFPLWMGDMPAVLKGFFEQVLRPGFALDESKPGRLPAKLLKGRSARVVVTMGMPAFFYRLYYRGHSVKSLRRNILGLCGIAPVRTSMVGLVGVAGSREKWLAQAAALGRKAG